MVLGFVAAMRDNGCEPLGKRALLVGAGGAGSAIAHALVMAGVSGLAIHDEDAVRRTSLVDRLATLGRAPVTHGSPDPAGFDIVLNATPVGMRQTLIRWMLPDCRRTCSSVCDYSACHYTFDRGSAPARLCHHDRSRHVWPRARSDGRFPARGMTWTSRCSRSLTRMYSMSS